jgi:hypothetical protein
MCAVSVNLGNSCVPSGQVVAFLGECSNWYFRFSKLPLPPCLPAGTLIWQISTLQYMVWVWLYRKKYIRVRGRR